MFGGHRRGKQGWGTHGKHIVFGIYQRGDRVVIFLVPDRKRQIFKPLMEQHIEAGRVYCTDDFHGYVVLEMRGRHEPVTHERDEYIQAGVNLSGIDGFRQGRRHQDLFPFLVPLIT